MSDQVGYGVLLPHFGSTASRKTIVEDAIRLENWGFDSVWVRDHVVYHPHHYEDQDRTFIDPFVALSAIASVTKRITLATGSMVPHRNPIQTALILASLDFLAGPDRLLIGCGLGNFQHEFDALGIGQWDRRELVPEQIDIMRRLWTGEQVSYEGKFFSFEDVEMHPMPQGKLPLWYCGTSPASVRRAVEYCDGWSPGRMPRQLYTQRMARMRRLADEAGKPMPTASLMPWVSPASSVEQGRAAINVGEVLAAAVKAGISAPDGGAVTSLDDLPGTVIAGPAEVIAEEVKAYEALGARHIVFDMRARFDDWDDCISMLGEEVLPLLRSPASSYPKGT
jgi:probable F420-dependent oxidoreductase